MTVKVKQQAFTSNGETLGSDWQTTAEILSQVASLDGGLWQLCLIKDFTKPSLWSQLEVLSINSADPNPFYSLPLFEHVLEHFSDGNVRLLCLFRRHTENHSELRFAMPVFCVVDRFSRLRIMRNWTTHFSPLGTPLVDSMSWDETVAGLIDCLTNFDSETVDVLVFDDLPASSRFFRSVYLNETLARRSLQHGSRTRASINSSAGLKIAAKESSGKRRQRLNKAKRSLAELGEISFQNATSVEKVKDALHEHISLENLGWKGRKGTSILGDPLALQFVKTAIPEMTSRGSCCIHALKLGDQAIASMIMLQHQEHFYPWKIAFDEAYKKFSAGNLLLDHVNSLLLNETGFQSLDSLASEVNQTARRFWIDELKLTSFYVGLGEKAAGKAIRLARSEDRFRKLKTSIKRLAGHSL